MTERNPKKRIINVALSSLIILGLFIVSAACTILAILLREGAWNSPKGLGIFVGYALIFGITAFGLVLLKKRLGFAGVLIPVVLGILLLLLPKAWFSSLKFSLKIAPFYIAIILGLVSGYIYYIRESKRILIPALFAIFPLAMALGPYDMWVHKVEYGTFTGKISDARVIDFELENREGLNVTNDSLKGKIVIFDFWFISCGPCWGKFPQLQNMYDQYRDNPDVEIYAVNRPMRRDEPGELYSSIEEEGYSFPVLKGTQETMDAFGVYVYPTTLILNKEGEVVFMGEIEKIDEQIQSLLQ